MMEIKWIVIDDIENIMMTHILEFIDVLSTLLLGSLYAAFLFLLVSVMPSWAASFLILALSASSSWLNAQARYKNLWKQQVFLQGWSRKDPRYSPVKWNRMRLSWKIEMRRNWIHIYTKYSEFQIDWPVQFIMISECWNSWFFFKANNHQVLPQWKLWNWDA